MRSTTFFAVASGLFGAVHAQAPAKADPVTGSPPGTYYVATLASAPGSTVGGTVSAESAPDGKGIKYSLSLSGLEKTGSLPYLVHVHAKAIPAGGKCADAAAHFSQGPTALNWNCNLKYAGNDFTGKLELCEIGQLSGKYGNITAEKIDEEKSFADVWLDAYSSLKPGDKQFIGDKSVVIHNGKNDRLACANFKKTD